MDEPPTGFHIRLHLADGTSCLWHKQGRTHILRPELAPVWVDNFNRAIFQALPDGSIMPRGEPGAVDIDRVEMIAIT